VSSANCARLDLKWVGMSFVYIMNKVGDRQEPCGTPAFASRVVDKQFSYLTTNFLFSRNDLISLIWPIGMSIVCILYNKPSCHTVSNALARSMNTAAVCSFWLRFMLMRSIRLVSCVVVEWPCRKACCSSLIFPWILDCRTFRIIFSYILESDDSNAIGRWFAGNRWSFPGLGIEIMAAVFHASGK